MPAVRDEGAPRKEDADTRSAVGPRERWLVTLAVVGVTTAFALIRLAHGPDVPSDLDQLWYAARALLHGADPYLAVGPGRAFPWEWPLFYPLPAVMLVVPFSLFPLTLARVAFAVVASAALGYAVGARWRILWPMLLSTAYYLAISRNQFAPFILAAIWIPALGFVVAAKPNIGLLAFAAQRRRGAVLIALLAAGLGLVSVLIRPSWPGEWLAIVRTLPNQQIAVLQPLGVLLLASLILWKTADGRLLLAASLVPQTPSLYDVLPLFAVCRTLRQTLVLAAFTHVLQLVLLARGPYPSYEAGYEMLARLDVWLALLPALVIGLWNHRGGTPTLADVSTGARAADSMTNWTNRTLFVIVALGLGLQLWLVFRA